MVGYGNLRKQLGLIVRYYQWSYAIFWSISITQPSVLEWGNGYYNGDIMTRKTAQSEEINAELINSQRSDQLRELYESLAAGESTSQTRRPSAALSPEDLTDTEWYYLVCMSFEFNISQGLPGRAFEVGEPIWLCNAHIAESKEFNRSLLAKSAAIQTVTCFPFYGGVVEMGVTEMVPEDMNLIERIKASLLDILPQPTLIINNEMALAGMELDHNYLEANLDRMVDCEELDSLSADYNASKVAPDQVDDTFIINGGASQAQSWHFVDEDFSNCVHDSFNSNDCISQTSELSAKLKHWPKSEKFNNHHTPCPTECTKLKSVDVRSDDLHYRSVISTLLESSDHYVLGPRFGCCKKGSSFVKWNGVGLAGTSLPSNGMSQMILKKVLFDVGRMHSGCTQVAVTGIDEFGTEQLPVVSGQGDVLDQRFLALRSLVPSNDKVDKVMLLAATIKYAKELEKRVEKLESSKDSRIPWKSQETFQQCSDNYRTRSRTRSEKTQTTNKRKASHMDQFGSGTTSKTSRDSSSGNIYISIVDNNVMIEIRCGWRESLLLEVIDAVSNLSLDSHLVQSSTADGILQLTIKSKFKGPRVPSVGVIRQQLRRIVVQRI